MLEEKAVNDVIEVVAIFKELCRILDIDKYVAFATETIRKCHNQFYIVRRLEKEAGVQVRILSGEEEGYYSYLAINKILSYCSFTAVLMDVGGGSTEIVLVQNGIIEENISLPFGAALLTEKFKTRDGIDCEKEESIKNYVDFYFDKIGWLKTIDDMPIIGIGGTFKNLLEASTEYYKNNDEFKNSKPSDVESEFSKLSFIKKNNIIELYNIMNNMDIKERGKIEGLAKGRADIILAGTKEIIELINYCKVGKVLVSNVGIRDGIAIEMVSM